MTLSIIITQSLSPRASVAPSSAQPNEKANKKANEKANEKAKDLPPRNIAPIMPTLRLGDRGDTVFTLQQWLSYYVTTSRVDGIFGPQMERAVQQYQESRHLKNTDGIIGECTWAALARDRASLTHWPYPMA